MARLDAAARFIPTIEVHHIRAGKVVSIADVLRETNRALHQDRLQAYRLPTTRELIAQELTLFEAGSRYSMEDIGDNDRVFLEVKHSF